MVNGDNTWEFAGIFSTEKIAVENCFDENYFVARVKLDEQVPQESCDFEYSYYPLA